MRSILVVALAGSVACTNKAPTPFEPEETDSPVTTDDGGGDTDLLLETGDTFVEIGDDDTDVVPGDTDVPDTDPGPIGDSSPLVDTGLDTADTADTALPSWSPDSLEYYAELGVDAAGAVHYFRFQKTNIPAYFEAHYADATHDCWLVYELLPGAFGFAGQAGLSPALTAFFQRSNSLWGFEVGSALYVPTRFGDCGSIDPAFFNGVDPHEAAIGFGASGSLFGGFDLSPDAQTIADFAAAGIAADIPFGGTFELPVSIGGVNAWPASGVWAHVNALYEPELDATGQSLLLRPRADAWNGTQPAEGFYRWFPSIYLTFGP